MTTSSKLRTITTIYTGSIFRICECCLHGEGEYCLDGASECPVPGCREKVTAECHTPGCAFWMRKPLDPDQAEGLRLTAQSAAYVDGHQRPLTDV